MPVGQLCEICGYQECGGEICSHQNCCICEELKLSSYEDETPEFLEGDVIADMSRDTYFINERVVIRFIAFNDENNKLGRLIPMSEDEYQALKKYILDKESYNINATKN